MVCKGVDIEPVGECNRMDESMSSLESVVNDSTPHPTWFIKSRHIPGLNKTAKLLDKTLDTSISPITKQRHFGRLIIFYE